MAKNVDWLEIMFWIVIVVLFVMVLTRIFGHSATDVQIYITIVVGFLTIMSYLIKSNSQLNKLNREIGEIKIQTKNCFERVREDISKLRGKN